MSPNLDAQLNALALAHALPVGASLTPGQRETLAGFTGWGALAPAFGAEPAGQWAEVADRLDEVVPASALTAAREQLDTSFFTPRNVTDAVFSLLRSAGFTGGRVLEPGCGAGAFMSAAPVDLPIDWTGVEVDPTAARIARLLHPAAEILEGKVEVTALRDDYFDAVVGNVPFSSVRVRDKADRFGALHNYFVWRAVDAVRPGGYVILVTSRHAIDGQDRGVRQVLDQLDRAASLIGAIRLPEGAFASAGTDVVTDILVIRKNDSAHRTPVWPVPTDTEYGEWEDDWRGHKTGRSQTDRRPQITEPVRDGLIIADPPRVSVYWAENPDHVAGRMLATGWDRNPVTVRSDHPASDIARAVASLAATLPPLTPRAELESIDDVVLADAEGRKEGSFHLVDGQIVRVTGGQLAPVRQHKELAALIGLRDLATDLLTAESDVQAPLDQITPLRHRTLTAYDEYVSRFGNLNRGTLVEGAIDEETALPALSWRRPAMGGFRRDPDAPLVMALETFDQDTGEAGPAPILLHRVNRLPDPVEHVDTPAEALAVSLGESGLVDLDRIAGLLDLDDEDAARQILGDLVFDDPSTRRPIAAAEYLSGNVRQKLEEARAAGVQRNIAALEAALPRELGPLDIQINLGSPFALTVDIEAFLREEMGVRAPRVTRVAEQGVWEVNEATSDPTAQMQYGTADAPITYLVECALNARMPEIIDRTYDSDRRTWVSVRNVQKSAAANEKLELIRDRFTTWVWEDEDRATRICTDYNRKLNSHVTRVYDGSGLTFPGIASDFTPWPHQRAAVERIVSSPRALLAHPVGAGKSAEMFMGARTLRQFGLANKPLIVVPNHLLEQIAREAQQTFPTGRFLIACKDDLARDARRLFAARCATGDWDAVIMTHSAFTSIPVHPDAERAWLNEQKHRLQWALTRAVGGRKEKGPKAAARAIRALEARIGKLRSNALTDKGSIWFEQLGVDYIMVDEAHLFRRLDLGTTNRDNSGMGSGSSKRATDLLVKIETLAARRPAGAPIVSLFTGTPWSNTLAETWVWQRYLQPSTLDDVDLLAFDAWVSAFIRYETNIEVSPDGGGFRMQRRPVGVVNAPELKTMLAQVADIIDPESLGLHRPAHTVETVVVDPTPKQRMFVRGLAARADAIRNKVADRRATRDGGETDDSMLLVCNDGRKVALDPRLVGIDEQSAKILKLAELIADAHHANARRAFGSHPAPGNFQLVFLDLGTPKPGESQTYGRLRRHLVDLGVPAQRIRFVHEATTDKARAALFASCRDGEVAVLIGSTSKVGMGTNVQTRLTHLWHADAPWLPSDVIQRDGRAVRPGNLSEHVTITRVVTEGTFDAYTWQTLERKSRSFDALYATGATAREIEDVSGATISYGEVKALASGNPLLLEQAEASAEVAKLRLMQSVHLQSVKKAERTAKELDERAASLRAAAERGAEVSASLTEPQDEEKEALLAAVSAWKKAERNVNGYGLSYGARAHARWRGTELVPIHEKDRLAGVTIVHRYTSIHTLSLAPKTLRRGAPQVTETIAKLADRWLDDLSARIADWRRTADECAAQAEEARYAAATTSFPDEGKLRAAVTRLARIDAQIQADAEAATRVAA